MPSIRPYQNQLSWDVLVDCKPSTYSPNWWVFTLGFWNYKPARTAQLVNNKLTGSQEEKYLIK